MNEALSRLKSKMYDERLKDCTVQQLLLYWYKLRLTDCPEACAVTLMLEPQLKSSLSSDHGSSTICQSEERKEPLLDLLRNTAKQEWGIFFEIGGTEEVYNKRSDHNFLFPNLLQVTVYCCLNI